MPALVAALCAALYAPLPVDDIELHLAADDSVWLVVPARVSMPAEGVTVAWDLAALNADASRARLFLPPSAEVAWSAVRGSMALWRLQPADGTPREVSLRLAAPARELKIRWSHRVEVQDSGLRWAETVTVSDWKPHGRRATLVIAGKRVPVQLTPGRALTVPVRVHNGVAFHEVVRWDSNKTADGCVRTLITERRLGDGFGRLRLPAGDVTVIRGRAETTATFPGARPGETVELSAGRAEGVTVQRLRAASKQVNVREDVHRRLAAYDEQIEYEYAAMNASDKPVVLEIVEHPARGWKVTTASCRWRRKDADTLIFTIDLKPGERATVKATVLRANQLPP